jgi:hypothetical protein
VGASDRKRLNNPPECGRQHRAPRSPGQAVGIITNVNHRLPPISTSPNGSWGGHYIQVKEIYEPVFSSPTELGNRVHRILRENEVIEPNFREQ